MGYDITFESTNAFEAPITKDEFDHIKIEVNPRRKVKTLIEAFIDNEDRECMIEISYDYFTILTHDIRFDAFLEDGGHDTVYRDKWYVQICQYAGFKMEEICSRMFHTFDNAKLLLHVIGNVSLYRNRFYRTDLTPRS